MLYEIEYWETNVGFFDVEADTEEEAYQKFWDGVTNGEFDLLDTFMEDSGAVVHVPTHCKG